MTGADIVATAQGWIGTPFQWQASVRGVGADCKGFVIGVARELGLPEATGLYGELANYGDKVDPVFLRRGLEATLVRVDAAEPGDVLLLITGGAAQHLGIFAGDRVLHTYTGKWVAANSTAPLLKRMPVASVWRFGSVCNG